MYEFRNAIAKITLEGMPGRGTGFLVASDLVATALHVVADRKTEPPTFFKGKIRLRFRDDRETEAEVIKGKWNQDADCVLLRCISPKEVVDRPIIPLREVDPSDELIKMRGYPDAQPVNGTTWGGTIRDCAAQLTNFYEGRQSPYEPVLQLFSEEAGAGTGAPPSGMSGAPVIIGSAAVGLVRFALMQDGRTVAGTLYACSARDIVALDPERLGLRPPLAPAVVLTLEQSTQLTSLLVSAFNDDLDGLRRAIRFSLGAEVERSAPSTKDMTEFVSLLVEALVQQGPGMISALLRGAVTARPVDQNIPAHQRSPANLVNQNLRDVAEQITPYAVEPLNDDATIQEAHDQRLVDIITTALIALNGMKNVPALQSIMASYRPAFEDTRKQINLLARYKELHNCLHEVQRRLPDITMDVDRLKLGTIAARYLKERAADLRDLAKTAHDQVPGLPSEDEEKHWINILSSCADDMKATTDPAKSAIERDRVIRVPDRLARILVNSFRINEKLVDAAKKVRLDSFADTMRTVEQKLGTKLQQDVLRSLHAGSLAVGRLRSRLAGLVAEHDEWQSLNTMLEYAKAQPQHQPQAKFSSWPQFRTKLMGLCAAFPQEEWSTELIALMKPWMADEPLPEPQMANTIEQVDDEFVTFYQQCIRRFIKVDNELNTLCSKLTSFTVPLDTLLKAQERPNHDGFNTG